jgi:GxxExxY protein
MLSINSTLPTETEELITRVIGCCITVHRALGPGLLETPYSRAVGLEFDHCGIVYTREKEIEVSYRGQVLCQQRLDFVVADQVVLEIKSVEHLNPIHRAQIMNYMRLAKLRAGLLMNFNVAVLPDGIKRIVL